MIPIQPAKSLPNSNSSSSSNSSNRPRRRPDLTLPLPLRDPSLAVPLPLPSPDAAGRGVYIAPTSQATPLSFTKLHKFDEGTVYRVSHSPSEKPYTLKVINANPEDSGARLQIFREIEHLMTLDSPNVVKCHGMSDKDGEIQILFEHMDNGSLEGTHISHEPTLADVTHQILCGLSYLHSKKIAHRNIKPTNLLINSRKQVKIAEFGVSRILAQTMDPCNSSIGTIAYLSPERINTNLNLGLHDGYAGDIWSLGVSILEFYLGRFPFAVERHGDWDSLMVAICISPPPEAPSDASREFQNFIGCCLQRDPDRRWTAAQLLTHHFVTQN